MITSLSSVRMIAVFAHIRRTNARGASLTTGKLADSQRALSGAYSQATSAKPLTDGLAEGKRRVPA